MAEGLIAEVRAAEPRSVDRRRGPARGLPPSRPRWRRRGVSNWSLRRRVTVTFVAATVVTAIAVTIGAIAFARLLDARERVIDRYDPAAVV